jgi:hypothetical protein
LNQASLRIIRKLKCIGIIRGRRNFFVVAGSVFDAIGFVNRLGDKVRISYQAEIRKRILGRYLEEKDADSFELAFSAAVIGPGRLSLPAAYKVLERAKQSKKSRLMVVFDSTLEEPAARRAELETARENVRINIIELQQKADSGDEESKEMRETLSRLSRLSGEASTLDTNILVLKKAEQTFPYHASK